MKTSLFSVIAAPCFLGLGAALMARDLSQGDPSLVTLIGGMVGIALASGLVLMLVLWLEGTR